MDLIKLGWNSFFEEHFIEYGNNGLEAGRVIAEHKHMYKVATEYGEMQAEISGKLRYQSEEQGSFPAVGDWVSLSIRASEGSATIHGILPRRSKFSRKSPGQPAKEQIVASNVDTVFLVCSLNKDFNLRRLERYLILAWESGANPVIVLSKADLCDELEDRMSEIEGIAIGVPVHIVSAVAGTGISELNQYLCEGNAVALIGSSGVGKSTLINHLIGNEVMKTKEIRETDDRGKHTSSHRELFVLPSGGMIIDTPGMREIQLWDGREGISDAFIDIDNLARNCSFKNCKHHHEPGCAVKQAIADGTLPEDRYNSYTKLQREIRFIELKRHSVTKKEPSKTKKSSSPRQKNYLGSL